MASPHSEGNNNNHVYRNIYAVYESGFKGAKGGYRDFNTRTDKINRLATPNGICELR